MNRSPTPEAQLLELLQSSGEPTLADRERNRQALMLRIAAGSAVATALVAEKQTFGLLHNAKLLAWLKGATAAAMGIGAAAYALHAMWPAQNVSAPKPIASPSVIVREAEVAKVAAPPVLEIPSPETRAASKDSTAKTAGSAAVSHNASQRVPQSRKASTLEAELELIGRAQKALRAGQPELALQATDEHQRKFPSGVLALERVGVRTVALCQAGRQADGQVQATRYLKQVPNSVLSKRIRIACQMPDE